MAKRKSAIARRLVVLESSDEEGQFVLGPVTLPAVPVVLSPRCAKAKEGPVALASLMEVSGGRWSAELGGSARACRDLCGLVGQHGQMYPRTRWVSQGGLEWVARDWQQCS